jgi:hypothetical protein
LDGTAKAVHGAYTMNAPANVLVSFPDRTDADFDGLSYLENELSNHGIAATLRALDDAEAGHLQRGAALLAVVRDAVRLMPLGTAKRAEWLQRASDALAGTPETASIPTIGTAHLSRQTLDLLEREGDSIPWCYCGPYEFGFFVSVPTAETIAIMRPCEPPPDDLADLWAWARGEGFQWVRLDSDADHVPNLPVFEHP